MPRSDSAAVFGRLLDDEGGHFIVKPIDHGSIHQSYRTNTAILESEWRINDEQSFSATDFCPRFEQQGRSFWPAIFFWLGEKCIQSIEQLDAGLWELRGLQQEHTFTNIMCWAGLDRIVRNGPEDDSYDASVLLLPILDVCKTSIEKTIQIGKPIWIFSMQLEIGEGEDRETTKPVHRFSSR